AQMLSDVIIVCCSILTHNIIQKNYLDHVGLKKLSKQEKKQLKHLVEEELLQMKVSDEMDSEIDSKKRLGCRSLKLLIFSDSSNQQDSGAGNHSTESESDEETTRSKRKPSLQEARWKRGGGRKPPESQGIGGSQKRRVNESEEIIDTGQSDLEEEGGTDLSEVEEISEKKREWSESEKEEKKSFRTNKAQQRMGPGTQEDSEGNESEDTSGSGPDEKFNLQKKMAGSQRRRKSRVVEDLGSSSEDSANQCPGREEGAKRARGESGNQQTENHSKPKRQPKVTAGRKKMQREDLLRKKPEEVKKMMQRIQDSPSEGSESESREHKSSEEKKKKKWVQDPTSSEGESQSEMNQGQSRKAHHSGKNEKHPFIQRLKRYIWECGAHRNYKKLLADCHSHKARIKALKEELESLGVKGPPSLAKCKAIKQKREEAAEMASLDINNIIFTEDPALFNKRPPFTKFPQGKLERRSKKHEKLSVVFYRELQVVFNLQQFI
uniref:HIRA interacting protein 3 n=1 Tax=Pseudonaja textilis TaxID=8673 RepID=A0A670YV41_PSETE